VTFVTAITVTVVTWDTIVIHSLLLDELLVKGKDVSSLISHNLHTASLVKLGMVSKELQLCIHQNEILYACALRTFPNIRDFPRGLYPSFYLNTFRIYFQPPRESIMMANMEIVTVIGNAIQYADNESDFHYTLPTQNKTTALLDELHRLFLSANGRRNIRKCVNDWKAVVEDQTCSFEYRRDAVEILERVAGIAEHSFKCFVTDVRNWAYITM
jgi:hypothetical protein